MRSIEKYKYILAYIIAKCIYLVLKIANRSYILKSIGSEHVKSASLLLGNNFACNEPLSKALKIDPSELVSAFTRQLDYVVKEELGIVALDKKSGEVKGVITVNDNFSLFSDSPELMSEKLHIISTLLGQLILPSEMNIPQKQKVYYSDLATIAKDNLNSSLLSYMGIKIYLDLVRRGYLYGYARITNPKILKRLNNMQKITRRQIFTVRSEITPKDFKYRDTFPFSSFVGSIYLVTWKING